MFHAHTNIIHMHDFSTDDLPRVIDHPKTLKNALPGKPVTLAIKATGTEPLCYQWLHKTGGGSGGLQSCDVERIPGVNSSTLTIPSVHRSHEGSYHCTVSNYAGSETSECATLTVGQSNQGRIKLQKAARRHATYIDKHSAHPSLVWPDPTWNESGHERLALGLQHLSSTKDLACTLEITEFCIFCIR